MPYLGVDFMGIMGAVFRDKVDKYTLTRYTDTARTPGQLTDGKNPTSVNYSFSGYMLEYNEHQIDGTSIRKGDRKVVVIIDTLDLAAVPPVPGDRITADRVYEVISVGVDPSGATAECQVRGYGA